MFAVHFWKFTKRENSTKRPDSDPAVFGCILKEPSGVINPTISLDTGLTSRPDYNYCYIPEFDRYYYVSEWTFNRSLWTAALQVDVLASFRDEIGGSNLYVLRSSAAYDGTIIDSEYPAKTTSSFQTVIGTDPFVKIPSGGWYVLGIASSNDPNYGSLTYYAVDDSNLLLLCRALNNDLVNPTDFDPVDASLNLQKALIDPFSYIKSCIWYPFNNLSDSPPIAGSPTNINVLGINLGANGNLISSSTPFKHGSISLAMPDHPDIARGAYMNCAYRKIVATIPPFGTFEIDPMVACNYSNVICEYHIDCISGTAVAEIGCGGNTMQHMLTRIETKLGVPIQLSAVYQDLFSGAVNLGRGVVGGIASALTGNMFGTLAGVAGGITDAVQAMRPVLETVGSNGSFASLYGAPQLFVQFMYQVEEDIDHFGKPLCQVRTPAALGGYMLIRDGDIPIDGTRTEAIQIRSYLESGFYYE